MWPTAKEII